MAEIEEQYQEEYYGNFVRIQGARGTILVLPTVWNLSTYSSPS